MGVVGVCWLSKLNMGKFFFYIHQLFAYSHSSWEIRGMDVDLIIAWPQKIHSDATIESRTSLSFSICRRNFLSRRCPEFNSLSSSWIRVWAFRAYIYVYVHVCRERQGDRFRERKQEGILGFQQLNITKIINKRTRCFSSSLRWCSLRNAVSTRQSTWNTCVHRNT